MAKKKLKLNLGTLRDSDHTLQPDELQTVRNVGTKPFLTAAEPRSQTFLECQAIGTGMDGVDRSDPELYPDIEGITSDIAHGKTALTPQSRQGVRHSFGGGQGGARKDRRGWY